MLLRSYYRDFLVNRLILGCGLRSGFTFLLHPRLDPAQRRRFTVQDNPLSELPLKGLNKRRV
jgi:hypothetical protein